MTVGELSERMGAAEYEDWIIYHNEEPFGANRDNWHFAQMLQMYATVHGKKGSRPKMADYFYKSEAAKGKENIQRMMAGMSALAAKSKKKVDE